MIKMELWEGIKSRTQPNLIVLLTIYSEWTIISLHPHWAVI